MKEEQKLINTNVTVFQTQISIQQIQHAKLIVNVKRKKHLSHWHFFADVILSATSKVQNYQNKTGEKSLYPNKYMISKYFKKF